MSLTCTAESARKCGGGACGGTSRIGSRAGNAGTIVGIEYSVREPKEALF